MGIRKGKGNLYNANWPREPGLINGQFYGSFVKREMLTEPSVYFAPTIHIKKTESRDWRRWGHF